MFEGSAEYALIAAGILCVIFLVFKSQLPLYFRSPRHRDARKRISEAKARARAAGGDRASRAAAWEDAADIALDELERPNLAATYARRAVRANPEDARALRLVVRAMREGGRYRALEKLLFQRLDEIERDGDQTQKAAGFDALFQELLKLYEGPMRRPQQARVLRRLYGGNVGP